MSNHRFPWQADDQFALPRFMAGDLVRVRNMGGKCANGEIIDVGETKLKIVWDDNSPDTYLDLETAGDTLEVYRRPR